MIRAFAAFCSALLCVSAAGAQSTGQQDPAATPRVVDKLAIPAGETRFALRGSVLRLVDVTSSLSSERPVPLAFEFTDYAGEKTVVETLVQVRGLTLPR